MPTASKTTRKPATKAKAKTAAKKRAPSIRQLKVGDLVQLKYKNDDGHARLIVLKVSPTEFNVDYNPDIGSAEDFVDTLQHLKGVPYLDGVYYHVIKMKLPISTFHDELYSSDSDEPGYSEAYTAFYENDSDYDDLVSFKTLKEASVLAHAFQYILNKREDVLKEERKKQEAEKKAEEAKRKAVLAKLAKLPVNQRQVVKFFQEKPTAFGCNRRDVVTLVSGLMGFDLKAALPTSNDDN